MKEALLNQIIQSIAEARDVDPMNLDISVERYVSTDVIQDLVDHESNSWRLQFEMPNHVVEVTGNDEILVDGTQMDTFS